MRAGEVLERATGGCDVADDAIVDIGDVHHPRHAQARPGQVPADQVAEQKSSEVADVRRAVDGRPTAVNPSMPWLERPKLFLLVTERVRQVQHAPRIIADGR